MTLSARIRPWFVAAIIIWTVVGSGLVLGRVRDFVVAVVPALSSFFFAGLLVAIFGPITRRLKARKVNDALAALAGVGSALVVGGAIGAIFFIPVLVGGVGFLTALPAAAWRAGVTVNSAIASYRGLPAGSQHMLESAVSSIASRAAASTVWLAGVLASGAEAIFSLGLAMFLGLILAFWFLKDGPHIAAATLRVVPARLREDVSVIGSSFRTSFSGYLMATAINTSLIFIADGIGFALIGLPYGWFIAAAGAILGIIPYLGSILSFVIAVLIGFIAGPTIGILTGLIVFVTDQVVYSFIGPVVASKTVALHPVMVIFALLVGASVAGIWGAVLSLPVAAAIRVIYIYYRDRQAAQTLELEGATASAGDG